MELFLGKAVAGLLVAVLPFCVGLVSLLCGDLQKWLQLRLRQKSDFYAIALESAYCGSAGLILGVGFLLLFPQSGHCWAHVSRNRDRMLVRDFPLTELCVVLAIFLCLYLEKFIRSLLGCRPTMFYRWRRKAYSFEKPMIPASPVAETGFYPLDSYPMESLRPVVSLIGNGVAVNIGASDIETLGNNQDNGDIDNMESDEFSEDFTDDDCEITNNEENVAIIDDENDDNCDDEETVIECRQDSTSVLDLQRNNRISIAGYSEQSGQVFPGNPCPNTCSRPESGAPPQPARQSACHVVALSFHGLFLGLAIGLQDVQFHMWLVCACVCLYRIVLSFITGMEMGQLKTKRWRAIFGLLLICLLPLLGVILGPVTLLSNRAVSLDNNDLLGNSNKEFGEISISTSQISQNHPLNVSLLTWVAYCMSTGGLLYVAFVLVVAREIQDDTNFVPLTSLLSGFCVVALVTGVTQGR